MQKYAGQDQILAGARTGNELLPNKNLNKSGWSK